MELQKEADVAKLNHRNIVALYATVCESGHYGIVMEFVLRGALDDYILSNNVCCSVSDMYERVFCLVVWSGVVVNVLASINGVTLGPVSTEMGDHVCLGSIPGAGHLLHLQPATLGQLSLNPSGVGK